MKTVSLLVRLWACFQPIRAEEPKPKFVHKPNVLSVMIGGALGQCYEVRYDERELCYYAAKNPFELTTIPSIVIKPTDAQ